MIKKIFSTVIFSITLAGTICADTGKTPPSAESVKVLSSVSDPKDYSHHASYLLVSCIDFRLRDEVANFMQQRIGKDTYDEFVIAGASLGAFNEKYPHWAKTFADTVELAIKLHAVTHVIFLDHRSCGAYKLLKGENCCDDKAIETNVHTEQFKAVRAMMKEKFPDIIVETLIMGLDGQVETINP